MKELRYRRCFGMLQRVALLVLIGVWGWTPAGAQDVSALERTQRALALGDARALFDGAAERVEVMLLGSSMLYSRTQAMYVLGSFFREYPPRRFVLQDSSRAGGHWFAAGRYWYEQVEPPLHVYLRLQEQAAHWELREIHIERRP